MDQVNDNAPVVTDTTDNKVVPVPNQNVGKETPEDIVARASAVKLEDKKLPESGFDRKKHDEALSKLDPETRSLVEAYEKELMSGANKKFQEASEIRKQAEALKKRPSVQELLQDPEFVKEAQELAAKKGLQQAPKDSGFTDTEWSALTDSEKAQFQSLMQNQQVMNNQLGKLLQEKEQEKYQLLLQAENEKLKTRFKNYDPDKVMAIRNDLLEGRVQASNEHLWKVIDYEDAVERAYRLGLQDRNADVSGKVQASSAFGTTNVTPANDVPVRQKNESFADYWKRIYSKNFKQN